MPKSLLDQAKEKEEKIGLGNLLAILTNLQWDDSVSIKIKEERYRQLINLLNESFVVTIKKDDFWWLKNYYV